MREDRDEEEYAEDDTPVRVDNPFWQGGAAAALLGGIAVAMYLYVCQPAEDSAAAMRAKVESVKQRIDERKQSLQRLRIKAEEIEKGDPQTIQEAIRQELLKGRRNDFLM